ncbi:MAG: GNAT family N-acetyltransferase, partial [Clostridiales Family XIII bacterium]|nr:GNAT family N-acetyltransferase [Clostridiales Family XIII bacterium]
MFSTTSITQENFPYFEPLLPSALYSERDVSIGCTEEGTACGAARLQTLSDICTLSWICVSPEFRGQGCAGVLLDAAISLFRRLPCKVLTAAYPAEADFCGALDSLLLRRGFRLFSEPSSHYNIPWAAVADAFAGEIAAETAPQIPGGLLLPLSRVPGKLLYAFLRKDAGARDAGAAAIDLSGANREVSAALVADRQVKGLLLLSDAGNACLYLDFIYLDSAYRGMRPLLAFVCRLIHAAQAPAQNILIDSGRPAVAAILKRMIGFDGHTQT